MNLQSHSKWIAKKTGVEIEICEATTKTVIIEITQGNEVSMQSVSREYIEDAIAKSRLVEKQIEFYNIRRKLDNKYYKGHGIWCASYKEAAKFPAETVEDAMKAFKLRNFEVEKLGI